MAAIKRIKRELQGLDPDAQQNLGLFVWGDDLHRLLGWIKGPVGSPYEGGVFFLEVNLPREYPFKMPQVQYLTKLYYECINSNNLMCSHCFCINGNDWSPHQTVPALLGYLSDLLSQKDTGPCPANQVMANLKKSNWSQYFSNAQQWTQEYAVPNAKLLCELLDPAAKQASKSGKVVKVARWSGVGSLGTMCANVLATTTPDINNLHQDVQKYFACSYTCDKCNKKYPSHTL